MFGWKESNYYAKKLTKLQQNQHQDCNAEKFNTLSLGIIFNYKDSSNTEKGVAFVERNLTPFHLVLCLVGRRAAITGTNYIYSLFNM